MGAGGRRNCGERGKGGQVGPRPGESSQVCPGREVALDV